MNFKGERFHIPLDEDDDYDEQERHYISKTTPEPLIPINTALVKDIQEHSSASSTPPTAPALRNTSHSGFPVHKKRTATSRFKAARNANAAPDQGNDTSSVPAQEPAQRPTPDEVKFEDREKQQIDKENQQRLAHMSDEQIENERNELMEGLSPSLIQRLLRRANINSDTGPEDFPQARNKTSPKILEEQNNTVKTVTFRETGEENESDAELHEDSYDDIPPVPIPTPLPNHIESSDTDTNQTTPSIHFPQPPPPPDLDPSSATFLTDLHEKYFPTLPSDPSKLAWMTDPAPDQPSPYSPSHASIPSAALRFSFRGTLIPPRTARSIPVTAGLHHHGSAPESAGYTVPELAHLSRSSFPAQRCVAFQTLGRLMYRLGRGEFGMEESVMAQGLWKCVREGKVLETLQEEAGRSGGHLSAKSYATEALWLWQKGGGQRWKAA